jgi:NAD(P)-dependent dehydrogenase (short-subunit alcohol dehydrogenase family)
VRKADQGRTILVAGATGGIGEGVTRSLLRQGARVVAIGRDQRRLDQLAARMDEALRGQLVSVVADVTSPGTSASRARIERICAAADGAFIAIGAPGVPSHGSVLDIPTHEAETMVAVNEIGGLHALQALVPVVRAGGAVVNVLGYSAEIPFPGNPLMASTNAAIRSLLTTLAVQLRGTGPRIYALEVGMVRTRARREAGVDDPRWLTGEQIGAYAADLIAGHAEQPGETVRYFLDPATGPSLTPPPIRG